MSFGYERQKRVFINDTALLNAYIYEADDETLIPLTAINAALFTVKKPSEETPTISNDSGTIIADGHAQYLVDSLIVDEPGEYLATAQFVLNNGEKRTIIVDFDAVDPFETTGASPVDPWVDLTWRKLEDCFDSEIGGPWLRDMTLARFDKSKIKVLLPDALLDINFQQPITGFTEDSFPLDNGGGALLSQSLLVVTIRHLMRSYAEQPDTNNSPVAFLDRRRYQETWGKMLEVEEAQYRRVLALWKRQYFGLGKSKLLVATKAGRLIPAPMRTRYMGRGYN
jgi:hypothetical protein